MQSKIESNIFDYLNSNVNFVGESLKNGGKAN